MTFAQQRGPSELREWLRSFQRVADYAAKYAREWPDGNEHVPDPQAAALKAAEDLKEAQKGYDRECARLQTATPGEAKRWLLHGE